MIPGVFLRSALVSGHKNNLYRPCLKHRFPDASENLSEVSVNNEKQVLAAGTLVCFLDVVQMQIDRVTSGGRSCMLKGKLNSVK